MKDIFQMASEDYGIPRFPKDASVAMAYVPYQDSVEMFPLDKSLDVGTVFVTLDKPFEAYGGRNK